MLYCLVLLNSVLFLTISVSIYFSSLSLTKQLPRLFQDPWKQVVTYWKLLLTYNLLKVFSGCNI